ncbi:hypothetical protein [Bacillus thuringiensis]|uniref:hypothetical protein n=1 Tax=Bacillus thuringiensis TaxID=1428 RepID=UPI0011A2E374|nr:hypothetical protein [Bacillus thuringiensis]
MGIGQKIANEMIDIAGSLVKRAVNDTYSIAKILVKHSFKTTFQLAKHTAKFSYIAVKHFSKKAKEHHQEKQLTKQKVISAKQNAVQSTASFNQYKQQPQQVQKQNNVVHVEHYAKMQQQQKQVQQTQPQKQVQQQRQVHGQVSGMENAVQKFQKQQAEQLKQRQQPQKVVYSKQFEKENGKKIFQERAVHENELQNVQKFYEDLVESGYVEGKKLEEVKKVSSLLKEEKELLSKNKAYKNSEYCATYDYVNDTDKGKKMGIKDAVKNGDVKEFQNEYSERFEIVKTDIASYYQKIEQTKDLQEKAFWAGRLENYSSSHKETLKNSGIGKEIREMETSKPSLSKTEMLEEKLKRIEDMKKGIKHKEEIQKKVNNMQPGTLLRNALEGKLGASALDTDMFFKTDKEKTAYRESKKQKKIEAIKHSKREIYF